MYDNTLGAILVAFGAGTFFFGVLSLQTAIYYHKHRSDPVFLKVIVAFVWLLELAHTCLSLAFVYKCLVTYFGDAKALPKSQQLVTINGIIATMITATVQSYSAFRLYQLQTSKSLVIPSICWVSSALRLAILTTALIYGVNPRPYTQTDFWRLLTMFAGILTIATDLLLGLGLFVEFWRRRHNLVLRQARELALHSSSQRQTPSVIDQVILLCISTNLFSCLCTTLMLILYYGSRSMLWLVFGYLAFRSYSIGFLSLTLQIRRLQYGPPSYGDATLQQPLPTRSVSNPMHLNVAIPPSSFEVVGQPQFPGTETSSIATIETTHVSAGVCTIQNPEA